MSITFGRIVASSVVALAISLSLTVGVAPIYAQAKKASAKKSATVKPATKPKANPNSPVLLGTTQLPGDFGQLGTTYTVGKSDPVNFTLKSAEYSITPLMVGNSIWVPKADQKLLVLHYTIHNPLKREQQYSWNEASPEQAPGYPENLE